MGKVRHGHATDVVTVATEDEEDLSAGGRRRTTREAEKLYRRCQFFLSGHRSKMSAKLGATPSSRKKPTTALGRKKAAAPVELTQEQKDEVRVCARW